MENGGQIVETGLVKYDITDAAIAKMQDLYMGLTITDIKNDEEFIAVHDARMVIKNHRVSVEKKRKELKSEALAWGKKVDGEANRIKGLLEPIESHLAAEEKKVTDEKERIRAEEEAAEKEKIQSRVDEFFKVDVILPFMDVALMSYDEYMDKLNDATGKYVEKQIQLEEERKAKQIEAERIEQVAKEQAIEAARLAKIKEDQEAIAMAQKAKEEALKAQERAIEDAKRKEAERIEREEFERKTQIEATKKARFESLQDIGFAYPFDDLGTMIDKHYSKMYDEHRKAWNEKEKALMLEKMEKERAEKMEREAREKKEKDVADLAEKARAEALRPDREKLFAFARIINGIVCPHTFKNESAKAIIDGALYELSSVADNVVKQAKEL